VFRFAVIADSHIRLPAADAEGGYPSNRHASARNRYVVECVNRLKPDFVIHLGDIVHPIPALASHEEAVLLAREIYAPLQAALYVLPGNHDIGDKANAWMPAPVVDAHSHAVFEKHWGELYRSFDHQDCHFVLLDTPILNSGLPREREQMDWLEADLARNRDAGRRLFVFVHYPLFLYEPDEAKHYDNIEEPARSWLLGLLRTYGAEAVFAGHVHNFFFNRCDGANHYILPSTAFVRPEYAELALVKPGPEFGRDDGGKLGFFMVRVFPGGHAVDPIRTYGYSENADPPRSTAPTGTSTESDSALGVSLRHSWASASELPSDGLDEFIRKRARNDYIIQALWELRIRKLRVPMGDLASESGRRRIADLVANGHSFTVFSIGMPEDGLVGLISDHADLVSAWEVIAPQDQLAACVEQIAAARQRLSLPIYLAPVVPMDRAQAGGASFQHFASHGFSLGDAPLLERTMSELNLADKVDGVTLRTSPFEKPWDGISSLSARIGARGLSALANVQLPRINEGVAFDDDAQTANHVVEAVLVAMANPSVSVFIDTFVDHDRGYYPRNGLIDRRYNPRPAFHALRTFEALLSGRGEKMVVCSLNAEDSGAARAFALRAGSFRGILHLAAPGGESIPHGNADALRTVDLQTGTVVTANQDTSDTHGPKLLILSE